MTRSTSRASSCRCGAVHSASSFQRLARVRVIGPGELAGVVVRWPDGIVVDVRACDRCGASVARLADPSAPSADARC